MQKYLGSMAAKHTWTFKDRLRSRAFGWKGSRLAYQRLKEAVTKIEKAARTDPVARFTYDLPSRMLGQFDNDVIREIARILDGRTGIRRSQGGFDTGERRFVSGGVTKTAIYLKAKRGRLAVLDRAVIGVVLLSFFGPKRLSVVRRD